MIPSGSDLCWRWMTWSNPKSHSRPWESLSSHNTGLWTHRQPYPVPSMEPAKAQGSTALSSGSSVSRGEKGEGKSHSWGWVEPGSGCQVSNGIMHLRVPAYFGSNSLQYLKSKVNFQQLSSLYTWTFVEEIMFNLQIPCGAYSALIPGVGIRAPCADRGEARPLQCRSLSVKETQNQELQP